MASEYDNSQRPQTRRDSRRTSSSNITSTASEQFMFSGRGGDGVGDEFEERSKSKFMMPRPPSTPKQQNSASSGENSDTKKRASPRRNHYKVSNREDDFESAANYEVKQNNDHVVYSKQHSKSMYNDYKRSSIDNSSNDDPLQILTSDAIDRPISSRLSRFTAPLPPIGSIKPKHENVKLNESIEDSKIKSLIRQKSHDNRERSFDTDTQSTQHHHQHLPTSQPTTSNNYKQQKSSSHEELESNLENMKIDNQHQSESKASDRHHSHHSNNQQHKIKIPPEPDEDNPDRLLIGIRLPDGKMIERYFLPSNRMQVILDFASLSANKDFNKPNVRLIELPRRHIDDLTKTLEHYKLQNRTRLTIIHEEND